MAGITAFGSSSASLGVEGLGFNSAHRRDSDLFPDPVKESQLNDLAIGSEKIEYVNVSSLLAGEISVDQHIRGGQTDYDTGTGFWLGLDGSTAKFSLGDSTGDKVTWDGTTLSVTGTFTLTGGSAGGWTITSTALYSLASGTPSASPTDGVVLTSSPNPTLTVYEDAGKRAEYGYLAAGVYGLKGYATDGSTVIFELSDSQQFIGGWTFDNGKLSSGSVSIDGANEVILMGSATDPTTGTGVFLGKDGSDYEFRCGVPGGNEIFYNGTDITVNGVTVSASVITTLASGSELAIQGWTYSGAFSVTDSDTVAWAGGTLTLMNGDTYTITGANTGNMVAKTYIYLDIASSTTAFQTSTTQSDSVGSGKILVAVAENGTGEASFIKFGGDEMNIDAADIVAGSITANEILANTITTNEIAANTIVAGNIAAGTITTTEIAANTIVAGNIAATTITGTEISSLSISGKTLLADTGSVGGWTMTSTQLYGLASGTPSSTPTDGMVFTSGSTSSIKIYEDADLRAQIGNLSTGVFGIKVWDGAGSNVLFEVSDTQTIIAGWTIATDNFGNGTATFNSSTGTLNGTIITGIAAGSELSIQGWVYSGAFSVTDADTVAWAGGTLTLMDGTTYTITGSNTGNMVAKTYIYFDKASSTTAFQTTTTLATSVGSGKILIAVAENGTTDATFIQFGTDALSIDGSSIASGTISSSANPISSRGWTSTLVFSVTDADTVAWANSGTIELADGTTYTISPGANTGNIAAKTYIYLDIDTSTTALQTSTTASDAVGDNKILIAVATNGTNEATFFAFNNSSQNIDGTSIVSGSITANEITAGTITTTEIASNTIVAGNIAAGTITTTEIAATTIVAGNIAAGTITTTEIAANTIVANNIASNTITASEIAATTITGTEISSLSISGKTLTADTGSIGAWNMTSTQLYALASGTPSSSPTDGIVLTSGSTSSLKVYEDADLRLQLGNLSAGVFGIKVWDGSGSGVLFEVSDTQAIIAGWTIGSGTLANGTDIILDATNKQISITSNTFGNAGVQIGLYSGSNKLYVGDGSDQFFKFDGTTGTANNTGLLFQDAFGDGSDGDVTISGNTDLTTDMYYNNLTVNSGVTLNTANYRVFVKGTLTNNGTIACVGGAGTNGSDGVKPNGGAGGSAGTTESAGFFQVGSNGQSGKSGGNGSTNSNNSGSNGGNGDAGTTKTLSLGVSGVAGVAGGDGGGSGGGNSPYSGGTAGSAGTATAPTNNIRSLPELIVFRDYTSSSPTKLNTSGGPGGSGGGGGGQTFGTTSAGGAGGGSGGGGASGGTMLLSAAKIVNGATGTISVSGGAGGDGGNGDDGSVSGGVYGGGGGGGSGGSGGSGGVMILVYKVLTDSGSITVAGGSGGAAGTRGADAGTYGTASQDGSAGNDGSSGTKIEIPI